MSRSVNDRPGHKAKKRNFRGNRHTSERETEFASTSAKKLRVSGDCEVTVDPTHGYRLLNFVAVFSAISALVKCKECDNDVKFNVKGEQGLGFKISGNLWKAYASCKISNLFKKIVNKNCLNKLILQIWCQIRNQRPRKHDYRWIFWLRSRKFDIHFCNYSSNFQTRFSRNHVFRVGGSPTGRKNWAIVMKFSTHVPQEYVHPWY